MNIKVVKTVFFAMVFTTAICSAIPSDPVTPNASPEAKTLVKLYYDIRNTSGTELINMVYWLYQ